MAQRDIQDIANYMKQIDESKAAEEEACNEACKECEEQLALEDSEFEDEVIDKESLGFIDDADKQDESDSFYSEEEQKDTFEEDVSDCLEQEIVDPEQQASIEVDVFNEDGFGKFFTKEVNRNVPGVKAEVKKTLPNGDLLVKMSGTKDNLEKAFAFYVGKEDYDILPPEDKEQFEALLVFDDGDTLAEADYREAVAHCLDPIGVNASTASLADQDACKSSLIKEEKAKRFAKKALKCLNENDFSTLSDEDLDKLDKLKDAVENGKKLDAEQDRIWELILKDMGYTKAEWEAMEPEKRDKIFDQFNQPIISSTGFSNEPHIGIDPKTGKKFRYRNQYKVKNPETGEYEITAFNPNYDADNSPYQHPTAAKKQAKKDAEALEKASKEKIARDMMKKVRGRGRTSTDPKSEDAIWQTYEFAQMISALDSKQRKQLIQDMIDEITKENGGNAKKAAEEIMYVKTYLFGKKPTLRDIAGAWDKSHVGVKKFADETINIWKKTLNDLNIKSISQFKNMSQPKFEQFLQLLKINMEGRRSGSIVAGR